MLEFVTLTPGSIRAGDIIEYYSQSINMPLELWHKNQKLDEDRLVSRMKGLTLKNAAVPAHHQLSSPGKPCSPEPPYFLSPREAYELRMRSPPAWHNKLHLK